jgi:hypothetical protein
VRARLEGTRVIMLTSDEAAVPDLERHGISDWISKNDSRVRILDAVARAATPAIAAS